MKFDYGLQSKDTPKLLKFIILSIRVFQIDEEELERPKKLSFFYQYTDPKKTCL